jgi:hypothetical protein
VTKRIAYTLLTACTFGLLLSSSAFAQEKEPTDAEVIAKQGMVQKDVFRFVPTGKKISVYLLGGAHYDCTSWEAEVQTTKGSQARDGRDCAYGANGLLRKALATS